MTYFIVRCLGISIALVGCSGKDDRGVLDNERDFFCPQAGHIEYKPWGENGLMKVCIDRAVGNKNGSQFAATGGVLQSKAIYSNGVQSPGWTWWDANGAPHYEAGGYRTP